MDIYQMIINAIREYLQDEDYKALFLNGGCYWFAAKVANWVPDSYLMINKEEQHCAVMVEHKLCDITGTISKKGFCYADEKEVNYMKKHFLPEQNLSSLDTYITKKVKAYQQQKKLHRNELLNCND